MVSIFKNSLIYRFFAVICGWFSAQWMKSRIIRAFIDTKDAGAVAHSSIFYRPGHFLRNFVSVIYDKLRLRKLFTGSIFANPYVWCFLAAALAPVIPTMALLGIVMLSCVAWILDIAGDRQRALTCSPINRYVIMYAVIYVIATGTSVTLSGSLSVGILTTVFILSVFVIENAVTTKRGLDILVGAMVAVGVLVSLYGFYQYVFGAAGSAAWTDDDMFSSISTRVYSTLQNPNVLSEYLLLIIPLSAACLFTAKGFFRKFVFLCATGIMCICMILTFSRAGWLGLMFAAAVFLVLVDRRYILLGVAGIIALFIAAPDVIISRFTSIGDMADGSTSYRVAIWMGTISMLKDYWICGIGPGTAAFNLIYPSYSYNNAIAQHSHNLFLQIMSDTGICGIIVFILLIIVFIRALCSAISKESDRKSKIFQISALASVGGFIVQSMADYSFYNYRVMYLFWVFMGLSALFIKRGSLPEGEKRISSAAADEQQAEGSESVESVESVREDINSAGTAGNLPVREIASPEEREDA